MRATTRRDLQLRPTVRRNLESREIQDIVIRHGFNREDILRFGEFLKNRNQFSIEDENLYITRIGEILSEFDDSQEIEMQQALSIILNNNFDNFDSLTNIVQEYLENNDNIPELLSMSLSRSFRLPTHHLQSDSSQFEELMPVSRPRQVPVHSTQFLFEQSAQFIEEIEEEEYDDEQSTFDFGMLTTTHDVSGLLTSIHPQQQGQNSFVDSFRRRQQTNTQRRLSSSSSSSSMDLQ